MLIVTFKLFLRIKTLDKRITYSIYCLIVLIDKCDALGKIKCREDAI